MVMITSGAAHTSDGAWPLGIDPAKLAASDSDAQAPADAVRTDRLADRFYQRLQPRLRNLTDPQSMQAAIREAQEEARQSDASWSDSELSAAGLLAQARLSTEQVMGRGAGPRGGRSTLERETTRNLLGQGLIGLMQSTALTDDTKAQVVEMIVSSRTARGLGNSTATLGQLVLAAHNAKNLPAASKERLIGWIAQSGYAREQGKGMPRFLSGLPQQTKTLEQPGTDLNAVTQANLALYAVAYGDGIEGVQGAALHKAIGDQMGLKHDRTPKGKKEQAQALAGNFEYYSGENLKKVQDIAQHYEKAGRGAKLTALPAGFDPDDDSNAVGTTIVWRLDGGNQASAKGPTYLHQIGEGDQRRTRTYKDLKDLQEHQQMMAFGRLVLAEHGEAKVGSDGKMRTAMHHKHEGWQDRLGKVMTYTLEGAAIVGGALLVASGFGAPVGAGLIAASLGTMIAAGGVMAVQAKGRIDDRGVHGEYTGLGQQTAMDYASIAMGIAAPVGAGTQALKTGFRAAGMTQAAQGAQAVNLTTHGVNAAGAGYSGYYVQQHWEELDAADKWMAGLNVALFAGGVGAGVRQARMAGSQPEILADAMAGPDDMSPPSAGVLSMGEDVLIEWEGATYRVSPDGKMYTLVSDEGPPAGAPRLSESGAAQSLAAQASGTAAAASGTTTLVPLSDAAAAASHSAAASATAQSSGWVPPDIPEDGVHRDAHGARGGPDLDARRTAKSGNWAEKDTQDNVFTRYFENGPYDESEPSLGGSRPGSGMLGWLNPWDAQLAWAGARNGAQGPGSFDPLAPVEGVSGRMRSHSERGNFGGGPERDPLGQRRAEGEPRPPVGEAGPERFGETLLEDGTVRRGDTRPKDEVFRDGLLAPGDDLSFSETGGTRPGTGYVDLTLDPGLSLNMAGPQGWVYRVRRPAASVYLGGPNETVAAPRHVAPHDVLGAWEVHQQGDRLMPGAYHRNPAALDEGLDQRQARVHPRSSPEQAPVVIKAPSLETGPSTWQNRDATAVFVPDGRAPLRLNGVPVHAWETAPRTADEWARVPGQREGLDGTQPARLKASGVVVVEPDGRIWMLQPTNNQGQGGPYGLPASRIESGLTPQANALKTLYEQTGLQGEVMDVLPDLDDGAGLTRYYVVRRVGGDPTQMGTDAQAVVLAPPDQAQAYVRGFNDEAVLSAYQERVAETRATDADADEADEGGGGGDDAPGPPDDEDGDDVSAGFDDLPVKEEKGPSKSRERSSSWESLFGAAALSKLFGTNRAAQDKAKQPTDSSAATPLTVAGMEELLPPVDVVPGSEALVAPALLGTEQPVGGVPELNSDPAALSPVRLPNPQSAQLPGLRNGEQMLGPLEPEPALGLSDGPIPLQPDVPVAWRHVGSQQGGTAPDGEHAPASSALYELGASLEPRGPAQRAGDGGDVLPDGQGPLDLLADPDRPTAPSTTALRRARTAVQEGTATPVDLELLVRQAVQDTLLLLKGAGDFLAGVPAQWRYLTGTARPAPGDAFLSSFDALLGQTAHPAVMRRFDSGEVFGFGQHAFRTVEFAGNPPVRYLVDEDFARFANAEGANVGKALRSTPAGEHLADSLQRDGYAPLTEEHARLLALALGAPADQAVALGMRLMRGEHSAATHILGGPEPASQSSSQPSSQAELGQAPPETMLDLVDRQIARFSADQTLGATEALRGLRALRARLQSRVGGPSTVAIINHHADFEYRLKAAYLNRLGDPTAQAAYDRTLATHRRLMLDLLNGNPRYSDPAQTMADEFDIVFMGELHGRRLPRPSAEMSDDLSRWRLLETYRRDPELAGQLVARQISVLDQASSATLPGLMRRGGPDTDTGAWRSLSAANFPVVYGRALTPPSDGSVAVLLVPKEHLAAAREAVRYDKTEVSVFAIEDFIAP